MRRRRFGAVAVVVLAALAGCAVPLSDSELASRVQTARPEWQSYQEDIKGQLGAGPVAEWSGEPVRALSTGTDLALTFKLAGKWASRDVFVPVLVRDPLGRVHRHAAASRENGGVQYRFSLGDAGSGTILPWAEVKFPGAERRLVFDQNGAWQAAGTSN